MSIFCWNCQGAGSSETEQQLRVFRRKFYPDFLFLMETKQKRVFMEGFAAKIGLQSVSYGGAGWFEWWACCNVER